jgi:hypothetical protein
MILNPIAKKLGLKPGTSALVVGAPAGYLKMLEPLPDGATISEATLSADWHGIHAYVQFFATRRAEVEKAGARLLRHAAPRAVVWITYPKKTSGVESDLSREVLWDAMGGTGWRAVAAVAIDDVWSGLRFRPAEDVKSRAAESKPGRAAAKSQRGAGQK